MSLDEALTARMARRKLAHAYLITGRDRSALADTLAAILFARRMTSAAVSSGISKRSS